MNEIHDALAHSRTVTQLIADAYESATPKDRRRVELVVYRCEHGCLLLTCWQSPMGRLVRLPAYRLSVQRSELTAPSAREKNTSDGERRWNPRHLPLEDLLEWGDAAVFDLNCDHRSQITVAPSTVDADAKAAEVGRPTRRVMA